MSTRIAVIDRKKCSIKKCGKECIKFCPRVRAGDDKTIYEKEDKIFITEEMCIGCGICIKKCPFNAITIVNLPHELKDMIHQFGKNTFRLYGLPVPVKGKVVGLLGANGIGKTTALNILAGKIHPNLGNYVELPTNDEILKHFRGTELQNFLKDLFSKKIKIAYKPQQVDMIPKLFDGTPRDILKDERGILKEIEKELTLSSLMNRRLSELSGGELQRVAVAACLLRNADVYFIDEPSSFLDVEQRLIVAKCIREMASDKAVIVVEHDLATLDFLTDYVHLVYGHPAVYGIISALYVAKRGINTYLDGYIREENIRFRDISLNFLGGRQIFKGTIKLVHYPELEKKFSNFNLKIESGFIYAGEVIGVFGANALGKTTFAKMLSGVLKPDNTELEKIVKISYKPQYLASDFVGTVEELLKSTTDKFKTSEYKAEIIRPLELEHLLQSMISNLSGGELQRVAIAACLSRDADFYLLDEPSAYLDVEQRVKFAKMIRRFIENNKRTCLIIDHDLLLLDYVSDRAIIFKGISGKEGYALSPVSLKEGMNSFLKGLNLTFRKDPQTGRPRANKEGSQKDQLQKGRGNYYAD